VNILCAVEAGRAAGTDAVVAQSLDGLFFQHVVGNEIVEVVASKVGGCASVGEFRLGSGRTGSDERTRSASHPMNLTERAGDGR
jgi:hypothetical protein